MFRLKKLFIYFGFAAFLVLGIAATSPMAPPDPPHKNLKILPKDISNEDLHKIMDGFNDALGVHCNFCHAPSKDPNQKWPDFASDEKPEKNIARKMMKMATKINKKYFGYEKGQNEPRITCGICHNGKASPEFKAPPHQDRPPGPPPPPPAN